MSRYNYSTTRFILIQVFLYSLLFWLFAPQFRFAFGPDFVSYTSIAKKYAAGNVSSAINSWWSPAYSWLLAICSIFSKDPLTANKILQFCAGIPAIFFIRRIIFFFSKEKKDMYAEWLCLAFVPALAFWGLTSDTPDFCSAIVLLWFFFLVLKLSALFSTRTAFLAGMAGALAYLFKSYNFYFITAFSLLVLLIELIKQKKPKQVFKGWIIVAGSFLTISLVWILLLTAKYNKVMISSIGWHEPCTNTYVLGIKHNAAAADCAPLQFDSANLISNWETPGHYFVASIQSFLEKEDISKTFLQNAGDFFRSFVSKYQLILLAVFVILLWNYWRKNGYLFLAFWAIYCGGYFLFHLEPRFFIMPSMLLMITISISFLRIAEILTGKWIHIGGLMLILVLFVHSYVFNLVKFDAKTVPKKVHDFAETQMLSNKKIAAAAGLYDDGIYFSFFTHSKFYGSITAPENDPASVEQLKKNQIDYLLVKDSAGTYKLKQLK